MSDDSFSRRLSALAGRRRAEPAAAPVFTLRAAVHGLSRRPKPRSLWHPSRLQRRSSQWPRPQIALIGGVTNRICAVGR